MKAAISVSRPVMGVLGATAALLLVPLVAMQLTDEVAWTGADFALAGVLLAGTGLVYVLVVAARRRAGTTYRWATALWAGTALFLIWANLAVGVIGSEDNPANGMYLGVLAVAVVGALAARFQPKGMMWTLFATALAQAAVTAIALAAGYAPSAKGGAAEVVAVNGMFIALWAGSGLLFRAAARTAGNGEAAEG